MIKTSKNHITTLLHIIQYYRLQYLDFSYTYDMCYIISFLDDLRIDDYCGLSLLVTYIIIYTIHCINYINVQVTIYI